MGDVLVELMKSELAIALENHRVACENWSKAKQALEDINEESAMWANRSRVLKTALKDLDVEV